MKSIDTNIVVPVITGDHPAQSERAARAVATGIFVTTGVLLETEWVLRSAFRWPRSRIADALRGFLAEDVVGAKDKRMLFWALDRYAAGADWADMLHVISSAELEAFLTFDREIGDRAGPDTPVRVELLA